MISYHEIFISYSFIYKHYILLIQKIKLYTPFPFCPKPPNPNFPQYIAI